MQDNSTIASIKIAENTDSLKNGHVSSPHLKTNIIEIIGPPGVGKSTLFHALLKTWNRDSSWTYKHGYLPSPKPSQWFRDLIRTVAGKHRSATITINSGLDFAKKNPELADFLWNLLSDKRTFSNDEHNKRFRAAYFLFKDFCRLQCIIENKSEQSFITDEGLLQKSFFINGDKQFMRDCIISYTNLIPLPRAVIYLDTSNVDILVHRLQHRNKTIASHIGLSNSALYEDLGKWQYMFKIIIEKMENKHVRVFKIDGENSVRHNVMLLQHFMETPIATIS